MISLDSVRSLVVRCPNWVGDIVMATPVFQCLRENFPEAVITACVRPYARGILENSPWFDHIVDCDDKSLAGLRAIRSQLSPLKPDLGLLLTNTTHSWITFKFAGIPHIVGYKRNFRRHFLSDGPIPAREGKTYKPIPMQDYYLELCRHMGLSLPSAPKACLHFSDTQANASSKLLREYGVMDSDRLIGLNPGASFGSSKCWPAENFAHLAELLQKQFACKLIMLVGPGEDSIAAEIVQRTKAEIINTADNKLDLAQLKPVIQRCDLLISNDTGPRHYAVAFDVPNIVLMGPTNPVYTARNLDHTRVLRRDLDCSPCHKKTCPLGHHNCMRQISPQMVLDQALSLLPDSVDKATVETA